MQWPTDVTEHIWGWTRILLRPGLKKRTWIDVHAELRKKWVTVFFGPLCQGVAAKYNEPGKIEEGGFEMGYDFSIVDTVRAAVAVLGVPNAWDIDGLFLDCVVSQDDKDKGYKKYLLATDQGSDEGFIVENAEWMIECMNDCGLEVSLSHLLIR